jgi:dienelactone hydrolase
VAGCSVTVATDDGSGLNAYLAVPNADGGPGLVLFPEGSGADQDRQAIADLYAAEGYVVLCPSGEFDATNIADITPPLRHCASVVNVRAKSAR